ncbi:MAG: ribonuclease P protein subunit [Nanohaloarchaea archaeon]|nr:ribonuclease P protein subunit [Candidatus Nanohaloarchaea archaeon]
MITPQNIIRHELVGLNIKVSESNDKNCIGVSGCIIDETKDMLLVMSGQKRIWLAKSMMAFDITIPSGDVVRVSGKRILGRPEERIRKKVPSKWKK